MPRDVRASAFPRWETTSTAQPLSGQLRDPRQWPPQPRSDPWQLPRPTHWKDVAHPPATIPAWRYGPLEHGREPPLLSAVESNPPYLQSQDGESARSHAAADPTRPRRRGDRIARFAAVAHVRLWQKADITTDRTMSAFGGRADIGGTLCNVPLLTQSG